MEERFKILSHCTSPLLSPTPMTIGVNAAGVTGVRTPPIFDLQGSISVLDPPNDNTYTIMHRHRPTAHYFRQLCGGAVEAVQ